MSEQETPMRKSELLRGLRQEVRQWEDFLGQIDPARMEQPGVNGDWSMKDMVAHLTGWNRWLVILLQAAQRGEPKPPPPWPAHLQSDDEINAWIYATARMQSLQEVLDEMQQTLQGLIAAMDALPEDVRIERVEPGHDHVWVGDQRFPVDEFFRHYHDEHEQDVRPWLARTAPDSAQG